MAHDLKRKRGGEKPAELDSEDELDGSSAKDIFGTATSGFTYDDLILLPGAIDFGVDDVCLDTRISRNIPLHLPLVSSPMDTVTGESCVCVCVTGRTAAVPCFLCARRFRCTR